VGVGRRLGNRTVKSYRELQVWRLGMELAREVYLFTRAFPREELYGLTSQARRATVSIPANIAEGHAKSSTKDFLRHLSIAQGSLAELETHLMLAVGLRYCQREHLGPLLEKHARERRMLAGLQRKLKAKLTRPP
jgi:four helix bundle protein